MLNLILLYKVEGQFVAMLLVTAAAFVWGASPERASAGAIAYMFLIDYPYHWIFGAGAHYARIDIGHAFIDLSTAFILVGIALRANRMYPLWLAAFQSIALASHLVRELSTNMLPLAYSAMSMAPSYLQLIVLAAGIASHVRRTRRYGPYRSWRTSSRRSRAKGARGSPGG